MGRRSAMKMQAIITGRRVHGVGYRVFLLYTSLELGFRMFSARNRVQDGTEQVVVQYEGEPGQVDALSSIIQEEHPPDAMSPMLHLNRMRGMSSR